MLLVLVAVFAIVAFAARQAGWLSPETGHVHGGRRRLAAEGRQEFRLHAIDAPELHQTCNDAAGRDYPCGREARDALRRLVKDSHTGLPDSGNRPLWPAGGAMPGAGHWTSTTRWCGSAGPSPIASHGRDYVDEEAEAESARRGIWQGTFENPENWRREHRNPLVKGGLSEDSPPD